MSARVVIRLDYKQKLTIALYKKKNPTKTYQEVAEWAKFEFELEKPPSLRTIRDIIAHYTF